MTRTVSLLADLYLLDREDLLVTLAEDATVFSTRVTDDAAMHGSLPLDAFESLIDRLKKVCLSAASSLLTDDPLHEAEPTDAKDFVRSCSFLQTRVGSFESRIKLPNRFSLGRTLENQEGIAGVLATNRIRDALELVFNEVIPGQGDIYGRSFLEEHADVIHIPLIRNISLMLKETRFKGFEFRFFKPEGEVRLRPNPITGRDVKHVTDYVSFLRRALAAEIPINAIGKVTELRSKDIRSSNNHIRVTALNRPDNRQLDLSLSLGHASYLDAIAAHGRDQNVEIIGTARRLKTYHKVEEVMSFRVI